VLTCSISPAEGVIAGLDPAIHLLCQDWLANRMDARVKLAHDAWEKALKPAPIGPTPGMATP
jgi:hypothetical protein